MAVCAARRSLEQDMRQSFISWDFAPYRLPSGGVFDLNPLLILPVERQVKIKK